RIPAPRVLIDRTGRASAQGLLSLIVALVSVFGFGLVYLHLGFTSLVIHICGLSLIQYTWSLPLYYLTATCCCYIWLLCKPGCNVTR
ncbi:hypothetical protein FB451DRAFT_1207467, partial [Mycena latifolia]